MLHEIIITLSGVSGKLLSNLDTFVDLKPFLHPGEITLLGKLLIIAKDYKYLKDFIETNHAAIFDEAEHELKTLPGLYIQAFCEGLEEVLKPYRQEIIKLEENILIGPQVTLIYIFSKIDNYSSLFTLLTSIAKQILLRKIHGCQILQLLYENILNSVGEVKESLECILKKCHTVFLKQTMNWLVNGYLIDSFQEFVIRKSAPKENPADESASSILSYRSTVNSKETSVEYEIVLNCVPLYINYTLVNDILFVGQIVRILNESPRSSSDADGMCRNLIFDEKEKLFFDKFMQLKDEMSLDMRELDEVVHDIRECVVKHLWKVAVEKEHLYDELQLLKNFYLLGFGQFFKEFLSSASALSLQSNKNTFSQNLNDALSEVAGSFPFIDEKVLNKFKFVIISSKNKSLSKVEENIWTSVQLQYTAKWPLNLLFKPVAIEHYNKLFFFLLRVKRCHTELHNVWRNDTKNKRVRCGKAWKLRNELMFLINNLQFYLQVDVIETEYCNLISNIQKVQDFQQIQKLHNIFLLNVLSHSFLLDVQTDNIADNTIASSVYSEHFYDALISIMKICEKFCLLSSKGEMDKREKEITRLDKSFQKYKSVVLCFLSEYQSQPFKHHVAKFLLRLNFNYWIDENLLTVQPD